MTRIPDDYSQENGVESDHNTGKCCRWSKTQNNCNKIDLTDEIAPHGSPRVVLPDHTAPADIAERVLDSEYEQHIGNITWDETGRTFMREYLAIRIYFGLFRVADGKYA